MGAHLGSDTSILNLQHQPSECGISQVEVPHVLESTLVDLAKLCLASNGTAEGVASRSSSGHLLDNLEGVLEQVLLALVLRDGWLDFVLDRLPNIVERGLGGSELTAVVVEGGVYAELVVGAAVAEVESSRDGEIGLEGDGKLVQDTLTSRRGVGDEDAGFGGIVNSVRGVDKLAHLQQGSPHSSLASGNRSSSFAIVEELVHDNSTTKTQEAQLDSTELEKHRAGLVDDVQVVYLILSGTELLENADIFASTPNSVYWDIELNLAAQEERELGEGQLVGRESALDGSGAALLDGLLDGLGNQRRVLSNMLQGSSHQCQNDNGRL